MKRNVSELDGDDLDWAVANYVTGALRAVSGDKQYQLGGYSPSTKWEHGGPVIQTERIAVFMGWDRWAAVAPGCTGYPAGETGYIDVGELDGRQGATPLIAAMRCAVAAKAGDVVDIPDA